MYYVSPPTPPSRTADAPTPHGVPTRPGAATASPTTPPIATDPLPRPILRPRRNVPTRPTTKPRPSPSSVSSSTLSATPSPSSREHHGLLGGPVCAAWSPG